MEFEQLFEHWSHLFGELPKWTRSRLLPSLGSEVPEDLEFLLDLLSESICSFLELLVFLVLISHSSQFSLDSLESSSILSQSSLSLWALPSLDVLNVFKDSLNGFLLHFVPQVFDHDSIHLFSEFFSLVVEFLHTLGELEWLGLLLWLGWLSTNWLFARLELLWWFTISLRVT